MSPKPGMGKDAVVTVLTKNVHPSAHIRAKYANLPPRHRLENCRVVCRRQEKVRHRQQWCIVFVHDDFMNEAEEPIELYAVERWVTLVRRGPRDLYFQPDRSTQNSENEELYELLPPEIPHLAEMERIAPDDENIARNLIPMDDDNEPAPENTPNANEQPTNNVFGEFGAHSNQCPRRASNAPKTNPRIVFPSGIDMSTLLMFELFFPVKFVKEVMLVEMNEVIEGEPVEYGEFLRWIGLWFFMATITGPQRKEWWSVRPIDKFEGAPFRLNEHMSGNRFDNILNALRYTNKDPPVYKDGFWQVRDLLDAWNENMSEVFMAGWVSYLDESMSVWNNKYACPGFMFVPRKPWPFGNEYHTICCGVSGILYALEIVEGKDAPPERGPSAHDELGKTVGLLLRLCKSLYHSGKIVVLDSGFCVLKGIAALKDSGVHAAALIKKRQYWPKYIDGEAIKAHFADKDVGDVDALPGELDGIPVTVFCMKEPDYVMSLMSSYGTNERMGKEMRRTYKDNGVQRNKSFQYPEVVHNHFKYRHVVDDHNAKRHAPISLEKVWATQRWENRVFSFLLAVTEVNANLGMQQFAGAEKEPELDFRKKLSKVLIQNPYIEQEQAARGGRSMVCGFASLPKHRKFSGTQIVVSKGAYPQHKCNCGKKKVRSYCRCSPGTYRCQECHATHIAEV